MSMTRRSFLQVTAAAAAAIGIPLGAGWKVPEVIPIDSRRNPLPVGVEFITDIRDYGHRVSVGICVRRPDGTLCRRAMMIPFSDYAGCGAESLIDRIHTDHEWAWETYGKHLWNCEQHARVSA